MSDALCLNLFGPLRVTDPQGVDRTPRPAKAQGLLALLATAPNQTRARIWLQDKLWSDRSREQGAASLRQALTEIRRKLGPYSDCLRADRKTISLANGRWTFPEAAPSANDIEFLEGIDIPDEEFEDWLRIERRNHEPFGGSPKSDLGEFTAPPSRRRVFVITDAGKNSDLGQSLSQQFADTLIRSLDDQIKVDVIYGATTTVGTYDLTMRTSATVGDDVAGLRVAMELGTDQVLLWSGSENFAPGQSPWIENVEMLRLVNNAAEGVGEAILKNVRIWGEQIDPTSLALAAIRKIFSMVRSEQETAETLLKKAFDMEKRGVYLAWLVMLRMIMQVERLKGFDPSEIEEIDGLAAQALTLEPLNSMVLVAASNAALAFRGDAVAGLEYAERAVRANPANPFALDCLSLAALYNGDLSRARELALSARLVSGNTQFGHWFDMGVGQITTGIGDIDQATQWIKRAAATCHSFHPPLRYLIALYANNGKIEQAHKVIEKLKRLEPNFEVERLIDDDNYPVRDLRRGKLLTAKSVAMVR